MTDCTVCSGLRTAPFGHLVFKPFAKLCTDAEKGCSICAILREAIHAFAEPGRIEEVGLFIGEEEYQVTRVSRRLPLDVMWKSDLDWNEKTSLEIYSTDEHVVTRWPFIPVRSHISADSSSPECLKQSRKWLDHCLQNHDTTGCGKPVQNKLPTRLISIGNSTEDSFIYESAPGETGAYAALSYCWGKGEAYVTTNSTYSDHKRRIPMHKLPRTCRDAVAATRALNIPFLWIDSLCIIQDCASDWEFEAGRMCAVYENALITLAALDSSDSEAGLFSTSSTRKTVKLTIETNDITSHAYARRKYRERGTKPFLHSCHDDAPLESRGWTFQETTLSPRLLWFTAAELGWQCLSETACECDPVPTTEYIRMRSMTVRSALHDSNTDWKIVWRRLAEEFSQRELTRTTDRLPALSGLAEAVQRRLPSNDEYLFGLWRNDLDRQLLWSSACEYPGLEPRCSQIKLATGSSYVPSWSWASVTGLVTFWRDDPRQDQTWPFGWKILDSKATPMGANPYGPGTGWVDIEGLLIPLEIKAGKPKIPGSNYRTVFNPDPGYLQPHLLKGLSFFFLVAISAQFSKNTTFSSIGLVLIQPHDQSLDIYRRAGLMHIFAGGEITDREWARELEGFSGSRKQIRLV